MLSARRLSEAQRTALGCIGLALLSVALYARSVDFDFLSYDDRVILLAHPELYDVGSPLAALDAIVLENLPREEPLLVRDVSWWLDAQLFGFTRPLGYHLGNVVLNAIAVVLFAGWMFALRARFWLAFFAALLFAAHPIHVEAVCWIMGRKDLLSACFSFAILIAHARYLTSERRSRAAYVATVLLYPLAVLSKFNALLLVPLLLLQDVLFPYLTASAAPAAPFPFRRLPVAARALVPHVLLACGLYAFYSWDLTAMHVIGDRGPPATSAEHLGILAGFLPWVLAMYARNLLSAQEHSIAYAWPDVELPLTMPELAGAASIVTASIAIALVLARYRRDLLFFYLGFFVAMVPYANIVYIGIWVADRYAYLSSGLAIALVVLGLGDIARRVGRPALSYLIGAAMLLSLFVWVFSTLERVAVFRDDLHLFAYEIALPRPNVSSYTALVRAELRELQTAPIEERARRLPEVEAHIRDGIARYESEPLVRNPHYLVETHLSYSKLLVFSTLTMQMRGASADERLPILFRAHDACPHAGSAEAIATVLHESAIATEDPALRDTRLRLSLHYFETQVRMTLASPSANEATRIALRGTLARDYGPYPGVVDEVGRVEDSLR